MLTIKTAAQSLTHGIQIFGIEAAQTALNALPQHVGLDDVMLLLWPILAAFGNELVRRPWEFFAQCDQRLTEDELGGMIGGGYKRKRAQDAAEKRSDRGNPQVSNAVMPYRKARRVTRIGIVLFMASSLT